MQSLKFLLSLSFLVSWTVRCTNLHENTKKKASPLKSSVHCFFKNLTNKEEKRSEFFSTLLICVDYTFFDKDEISFSGLEGERITYKTYMAEFSIKNEKNVESFDETGYYENMIRSKIGGKNLSYLDKLNLKILEHPSIIEILDGDYKETTINQRKYTFKKVELQLIKGLDRLKWIKLKDIEFKNGSSSEESKISELPRMEWYNRKIKGIEFETDFITILLNIFWHSENIEERNLKNFGLSAENIEIVNEESLVINILSKYFGKEVKGIHKVEKEVSSGNESDGKETKKDDSPMTSIDESSIIVSSSDNKNNDQIKNGEDKKTNDSEKFPRILSQANENNEKKLPIKDETPSSSIKTETVEDSRGNSLMRIQDSYLSENEDELEIEENTDNENDGILLEEDRKEENRESGDDEVKDSLDESKTEEEKKKDIEEESSEDQETEKDKNKKDGKEEDSENKKQSKDKKEEWGTGKTIVLSVVVIGLVLLLLVLGFLLYPRAQK